MRQFFFALVLILVPVAAFTSFEILWQTPGAAAASLGDLTALRTVVADVQSKAAAGDLAAAKTRITDFETAWDDGEPGMRPLNPEAWGTIDAASDKALKAVRAATPESAKVTAALDGLQKALADPTAKAAD